MAADRSIPAILHEDFGTDSLEVRVARDPKRAEPLYTSAVDALASLRRIPPAVLGDVNPSLDASLFRHELQLTRTEFFAGILGQKWDSRRRASFDEWVFRLGERLDALPRMTCHRNFHAANIYALADGTIGLLELQDIRPGPLGYDLASLLYERAANVQVDPELADDLLRSYARSLGLGVSDLSRAVTLCRLQRGWRTVGLLARDARKGGAAAREPLAQQLSALRALLDESGDAGTAIPDFVAEEARPLTPKGAGAGSGRKAAAARLKPAR